MGLALFAWFGPTAVRQHRWMGMAREHVSIVERMLRADRAFERITIGVGTGGGGTLLVVGDVAPPEDLRRLRSLVAESKPPVEAVFVVRVE